MVPPWTAAARGKRVGLSLGRDDRQCYLHTHSRAAAGSPEPWLVSGSQSQWEGRHLLGGPGPERWEWLSQWHCHIQSPRTGDLAWREEMGSIGACAGRGAQCGGRVWALQSPKLPTPPTLPDLTAYRLPSH